MQNCLELYVLPKEEQDHEKTSPKLEERCCETLRYIELSKLIDHNNNNVSKLNIR